MNKEQKQFYKTTFGLVLPMAIQNLINVGVTSADVIMLGKVGEIALSASSLAGQVYFVVSLVLFGLTSGACVLTAQYWGKQDTETIEKVLGISFQIGISVAFLATIMVWIAPYQIMSLFTNETAVLEEAVGYLKIISLSYVLSAFTVVYLNIIRSVERVVISTVVYAISLAVNIILNAIFIFGLLGWPAMGVRGAALGTVCARFVEVLLVVWYAKKKNDVVRIQKKYLFRREKWLLQDFCKYALPVMLNEFAWSMGMAVMAAIIGHLGSPAVAANSVAQVARQMATVVSFGVSSATAIMIGKTIGEGDEDRTKIYAARLLKLSVVIGAVGGLIILGVAPAAGHFLNLSETAKSYLWVMMIVMSYYAVCQSFNCTMIVGVCRAGGDIRYGVFLDVCLMWGSSILLGAIAAFVLKIPMPWVYIVIMSDEVVKIPFCLQRYRSMKWLNHVTR
ncbi:MAG: MATE family efflux transporter [Lachnospiraceae bacterium]|jgi:putative MATE family efflux protein